MRNSLKGCIRNKITIDEFSPKSGQDEEIIVVSLYAIDEEPAKDLNSFLQRGYLSIVDVEVSPNPDENGDYLIFIELERNNKFWSELEYLIEDVENLTGSIDWIVKPYMAKKFYKLSDESVKKYVPLENQKMKDEVEEFFKESILSSLTIEGKDVTFNSLLEANLVDIGNEDSIIEKYNLKDSAINILECKSESGKLADNLGENYSVLELKDCVAISKDDKILVLENLIFSYGKV